MGRSPCCDKDGLKKGPWLPKEDQKLIDYIQKHGPGNWRTLPKKAGLQRCGKSCRLRWSNYLRPDIKRGRFSFEEEETIIQLHSILGNKWSAIAAKLPGRTDNEIKNYWNTHIRKRLLRMGIDPVTHTRRFDLLNLPSIFNSPLQNSSELNLLKLLGLQSLVNPELLQLATLLSTTQTQTQTQTQNPNPDFLQLDNPSPMQNQFINPIQNNIPTCSTATTSAPVFNDTQFMLPNLEQYPQIFPNFDAQNFEGQTSSLVNDPGQSNVLLQSHDNAQVHSTESHYVCGDQASIMESLLDTLGLRSDNSNRNLSLSSVLSTPCSSQQTPLSSNSGQPNSTSSEDEIDSYCQNLMNFDIPVDLF